MANSVASQPPMRRRPPSIDEWTGRTRCTSVLVELGHLLGSRYAEQAEAAPEDGARRIEEGETPVPDVGLRGQHRIAVVVPVDLGGEPPGPRAQLVWGAVARRLVDHIDEVLHE